MRKAFSIRANGEAGTMVSTGFREPGRGDGAAVRADEVDVLPCGDTGISLQFGDRIDRGLSERIIGIKSAIDRAGVRGVVETVPTYRSLMIHYDPLQTSRVALIDDIQPFLSQDCAPPMPGGYWRVPVCYAPEFALDLEDVAKWADMTPDRVIELHSTITHYVYMLGFAPGQPHMGDLPKELAIPRRRDPRARIEKGSIVTAIGLTIIYPIANASGWHIIGRSPVSVFDPAKDPPALLKPGDSVMFYPVSKAEFSDIKERVDAGVHQMERVDPDVAAERSSEPSGDGSLEKGR